MDCKEAQVLLIPHIMGDLDPDSRQCRELEAHLLSCEVCAEEYENSKWVVEFIQEHKVLFAEAFETIDKKRAAEQEEIKRSWQAIQAKLVKIKAQEKRAKLRRVLWRATAVAACFVIGISVWLTLSNSKIPEKPIPQKTALAPAPSIKIDLVSDNGNVAISAGTEIKTTANELKTLIINGKHRMVLNSDTALSIEPLLDNERVGCMVKLASGEIFTHVEHDGNPFAVSTTHGKAIITGTTFDVKATDITTTLVVAEGTVQFVSEEGFVEVIGGHTSEIVAQSTPTKPVSCNTAELTAWATSHEIKTALAKIQSTSDAYDDLTDLWFSAMSGPIDLEAIDYKDWIEKKRDWFKREFPWIFQLQSALEKEGIEVDYPELLIQSGDVWQFVCLEVSPAQFSVINPDSLLKTASDYGLDKQWLLENVPAAKSALEKPVLSKNSFAGLKAFEQWPKYLDETNELEPPTPIYSFHAGKYLANTRSLIWFAVRDSQYELIEKERIKVLALLQKEVTAACNCQNDDMYFTDEQEKSSCDEDISKTVDERIVGYINTMKAVEERIGEYEIGKYDLREGVIPMNR